MLQGMNVLIVEDEPIIAFGLEDMLASLGCEDVNLATRLADAESYLEERSFDAAILDVNIHGETSYRVADNLADRSVPFIFATGYGDAQHSLRHALVPTITKPYSLGDVRSALSQVLAKRG